MSSERIDPITVLNAYSHGAFPMTDPDGAIRWYTADPRGIIPLDRFHVPSSLRGLLRKSGSDGGFDVRINSDFEQTMRSCMECRTEGSWISERLITVYGQLHRMGMAHSVECWQGDRLVGGLYGVSLGGAFFGESMFHRVRDASKVALVHLANRLRFRGFKLLDCQACTPHLTRFGCVEVSGEEYARLLRTAIGANCSFN